MTLAKAIIAQDFASIDHYLNSGVNPNELDEYGYTPLIEAAIVDSVATAKKLISYGADVNTQDITGNTPLHWAVENNNMELAQILLDHHANPNTPNLTGQSPLVMPILRHQTALKKLLYNAGSNETFAQDFINTKLLGHMFELVGTATIVDPKKKFVEVDFEGFYLEVTLGLMTDALSQFQNNYGARRLRRYLGLSKVIVDVMDKASKLAVYRHYRTNARTYQNYIVEQIQQEPLIIPIGYEGHAITFVKYGDLLAKCDRREDSRLYDNIVLYRIGNLDVMTPEFIMHLMYDKQNGHFINEELHRILALEPLTELKVDAQISGNCSWANVEACVPTLFFMILVSLPGAQDSLPHYKSLALNFFNKFKEWNKDRSLQFCIQSFKEADKVRKATKAEILAAILFQCCDLSHIADKARIEAILEVLKGSAYEYILINYLKVYHYNAATAEGARFSQMLKTYGVIKAS
jgi:hypothetical protein